MPEVKPSEIQSFASIKVVGVGGAGGSAVNRMKDAGLSGVQFIAMNTDAQALHNSKADVKIHLGHNTTNGLGAGADPAVGEAAATESRDEIREALEGADMVFVTIGAGGGTGSGAGHVVAEVARELGILVVGVATKPFSFEGEKRRQNAEWAIAQLGRKVDTLITIPNDRLLQTIDRRTPLLETFKIADDVLRQGVQGISELITEHGLINLDFADVKAIMSNAGSALWVSDGLAVMTVPPKLRSKQLNHRLLRCQSMAPKACSSMYWWLRYEHERNSGSRRNHHQCRFAGCEYYLRCDTQARS